MRRLTKGILATSPFGIFAIVGIWAIFFLNSDFGPGDRFDCYTYFDLVYLGERNLSNSELVKIKDAIREHKTKFNQDSINATKWIDYIIAWPHYENNTVVLRVPGVFDENNENLFINSFSSFENISKINKAEIRC